jgi:putative ABC transport system substrate-binding protein
MPARIWVKVLVVGIAIALSGIAATAKAKLPDGTPVIGYLARGSGHGQDDKAFERGMRDLGYVEGKNVVFEKRIANGNEERLPELAAELVRLKVDLIVALHPRAARAAHDATKLIPIVMRSSGDPVRAGLVASLAKPGGNVTGVTSISSELYGKRIELLKEIIPQASIVAVLKQADRDNRELEELRPASRKLHLQLRVVDVNRAEDFDRAIRSAKEIGAHALIALRDPLIVGSGKQIAALAAKYKLPSIYDERSFVEVGGLISYGTDLAEVHRRAATYVDKILKGRKPADLPVEQPTNFEVVVNLKTAKSLGVTIPPEIMVQATRVIQ